MRKRIYYISFVVTLIAVAIASIIGCDDEDFTGYSTVKVKSPSITITPGFTSPVTLVENDQKYEFTASLSEAQVVDVHLAVMQIEGTASAADYELSSTVVIPAGSLSGKGSVKILSDDVIEEEETLKIQIGDQTTANAALTPATIDFIIKNLTTDDLSLSLSWAASSPTTDDTGTPIDPTVLADLRLLITDSPYTTILDGADGASFETYTLSGSMDDGEYLVVADFYAAMDFPVRDLDLTLDYEQLGVIDPATMNFANAINTSATCAANYFVMAKIIKAGTTYTIEEVGAKSEYPVQTWYGIDTEFEYPSEVKTQLGCDVLISGLGFGWMLDFWGEEVIGENWPVMIIDEAAGTVEIPFQPYITTLYDGAEYPYSIEGSGTIDNSGEYPVMTITYILDQEGFNPSEWCFENGYMANPDFTATITADPEGLKSGTVKSASVVNLKPLVKPVRR